MGPVLLFNMGIIILVVSPGPRKGNTRPPLGKVSLKMVVQELRAIVAIKPQEGEGK